MVFSFFAFWGWCALTLAFVMSFLPTPVSMFFAGAICGVWLTVTAAIWMAPRPSDEVKP